MSKQRQYHNPQTMHLSQKGRAVSAFVHLPFRQSPARTDKLVDATVKRIDFSRPRAPSGAPLYTLRCRLSATSSASLPRHNKQINVRPACTNDVRAMADLTARAFCEQDDLLNYLQAKLGPSFSSLLELIEVIYVRISISEIAMQLKKRVGVADNLAHIALVAEHTETGKLLWTFRRSTTFKIHPSIIPFLF